MKLRLVTRAIVHDAETNSILLVRNQGATFWYPPGGGWDFDREHIIAGTEREVLEECGLTVAVDRMLYAQQFQSDAETQYFEVFWLARPLGSLRHVPGHVDHHGAVAESRWFQQTDLSDLKVFPQRLKDEFWLWLDRMADLPDPFIHYA